MMSPSHPTFCPECGKPVPEDSQHQVCPACLMAQALASRTIVPEGETTDSFPPPSPEEIADRFPQFEITECLGRGGMGVVYKARQKSLDRWVAIKILPPERVGEEKFADRFAREAQTLARLNHPNIVTVFDYGQADGLFYIVMEFVDGVNLRDLLRDGKLEAKQALAIVPPICEALQYAHDKGIVHRDIKPENLLLDRDGRIKIADFGIAGLIGAGGENIGTPPYMAPEQAGHAPEVDHRADIYALGVVFYEMLTGERPAKNLVAPSKKVQIDVRLDEMVLRALEKSPELRYQTAEEFRTVVETMAKPAVKKTELPPVDEKRKKRRKKVIFRLADGTPSRTGLLAITATCLLLGALLMFVAEPAWDFFTTNQDRLLPVDPGSSFSTTASQFSQAMLGPIGFGIMAVLTVFIFSLVIVAKGAGSGPGKGLAIGCLALGFGAVIVVVALGASMLVFTTRQAQLPVPFSDALPMGIPHPVVSPQYAWRSYFLPSNGVLWALALPLLILLGVLLVRRSQITGSTSGQEAAKKSSRWMMALSILIGLLLAVILFRARGNHRFYPASSLNPAFQRPVIGRVEFKFTHPEAVAGGSDGYAYNVKQGGDTRWFPSSGGSSITLKEGQSVTYKSRVDASGGGAPRAMVTTSRKGAEREMEEETKEMVLGGDEPGRTLVFANGLRVSVQWSPADQ